MTSKKLCGYDLNGWKDRAARNWTIEADGYERVDGIHTTGSVLSPCIVRIGDETSQRWIGGSQASLAPHGRGNGWGIVGSPERRKSVTSVFGDNSAPAEQLAASISGLAHGAKFCSLSIDDDPRTSERFQERLIEAMTKGKTGRCLLVWRSVLAVLGCLVDDKMSFDPEDNLMIGIIGHVSDGFTVQRLRLRLEAGGKDPIFAPERSKAAKHLASSLGYSGLLERSKTLFQESNPNVSGNWINQIIAVHKLALEGEAEPELIQNDRGRFVIISPPETALSQGAEFPAETLEHLVGCDILLFETLATGHVRERLSAALQKKSALKVTTLNDDIVAKGALEAARRFADGDPVYFDFLPQISTIVLGQSGATSYDLISSSETLPAGRVYRSPAPASFAIQANQTEFLLHLRKDLEEWPRRARVDLSSKTSAPVPVQLSVEQVPAAGRARFIVDAPMLSRQFIVDWDAAEEIHTPWNELVDELGTSPATIPDRLVLPCSMDAWEDNNREAGLLSLLQDNINAEDVDWTALARKLASRPNRHYCISSDGDLPNGVPPEAKEQLENLTLKALQHIRKRIASELTADNESLKFLTWQFRRSPAELPKILLKAWDARNPLFKHPFITHPMNWVLVYQGFGRTCRTEKEEKLALSRIFLRNVKQWKYKEETAAAAFLLSRSDTAPLLLDRRDVERLVDRVLIEFKGEIGSDYTRFNYAPFLLGGLLRWRLKVQNALVVDQDPLADSLRDAIVQTRKDFKRTRNRNERFVRAAKRYDPLLVQLLEELEGQGSNPNLLVDLFDV
ncbi:hypothetical protein [Sulfitobacter guttiformis]|uniref:Uncharacterized protein n=1 Tax=Sulfitobacter guttiformis TaxID=74349 RepID=A0A420DTG0_9RHOB|nr:hypothetical protein [Sulfitobacter guttiformis]KIN71137.1 hypothetical protein Z949_294 [Sulfitobacter guttiformis KCTC 32187]RKE97614.1 hypothetical protein C8N30_2228 [Sulfitobacter guttiformis]